MFINYHRKECGNISPYTGKDRAVWIKYRDHTGKDPVVFYLLISKVVDEFLIKSCGIHIKTCCSGKYLSIPGPAKSFIPLRAICRKVHKI